MIRHTFTSGALVREGGSAAPAQPLLYIHGLGESCLCFEGLLDHPELSSYLHLAPDLPGYGKSPWPAVPRRLEEQAEWLGQWLRESVQEPSVVIGHSMGGVVALMLAERHPDRVRALVNVEGNVSLQDCRFSGPIASCSRDQFLRQGRRQILEGVFQDAAKDPALRTYFASLNLCDPRLFHLNSQELVELSRSEDLAERLAALRVPQIYLLGEPRGTQAYSRSLLERAGIPWRGVPDSGHWPFLDQPEVFVRFLREFLESLD